MREVYYFLKGVAAFFIVYVLSVNVGFLFGSGTSEMGLVVVGLSILSAIVVVCTLMIIDTIKKSDKV